MQTFHSFASLSSTPRCCCAKRDVISNANSEVCRLMFDIYPKRIGQVLLVGAPLVFQPVWQIIKPLLGKYATLVQFVSPQEAYFGSKGGVLG